ncbi:kinesin-like protein NACK2 [Artemisia annua]|uniref:Kinesin-like protein NACK2 n=1 Tax=Artemisia annua TaxID=35608 RepID=A0A2U1MCC4_ARTAN|nr:kinesin-like protein NACK2 [Artemisia annua]
MFIGLTWLHYCFCKLMQRSHLMRSFNDSTFQTIESSLHDTSGPVRSLLASLLFLIYIKLLQSLVDLAGSERVAQTNVDGARLKEGSHINRSLLTLAIVIRKLSYS